MWYSTEGTDVLLSFAKRTHILIDQCPTHSLHIASMFQEPGFMTYNEIISTFLSSNSNCIIKIINLLTIREGHESNSYLLLMQVGGGMHFLMSLLMLS